MSANLLESLIHELRTPLNAIAGWLLLMKKRPADRQLIDEAIAVIDRNVRQQAKLLTDFSDLYALQSGTLKLHSEAVDMGVLIGAAIDAVVAGNGRPRPRLDLSPDPLTVTGDAERLLQLLTTLLQLQMQGAGQKAVCVSGSKTDTGRIQLKIESGTPATFAPAELEAETLRVGASLDYSIARLLAAGHGGELLAAEHPDGGILFTLCLPRSAS
jgi:signal transduction histidine kinase